jgi:hypothetical protein
MVTSNKRAREKQHGMTGCPAPVTLMMSSTFPCSRKVVVVRNRKETDRLCFDSMAKQRDKT